MATDNEWLRLIYLVLANQGVLTPGGPGAVQVQGPAAAGSSAVGNPVQVGGNDGGTIRSLLVDGDGRLVIDPASLESALTSVVASRLSNIEDATGSLDANFQARVQAALDASSDIEAIKSSLASLSTNSFNAASLQSSVQAAIDASSDIQDILGDVEQMRRWLIALTNQSVFTSSFVATATADQLTAVNSTTVRFRASLAGTRYRILSVNLVPTISGAAGDRFPAVFTRAIGGSVNTAYASPQSASEKLVDGQNYYLAVGGAGRSNNWTAPLPHFMMVVEGATELVVQIRNAQAGDALAPADVHVVYEQTGNSSTAGTVPFTNSSIL